VTFVVEGLAGARHPFLVLSQSELKAICNQIQVAAGIHHLIAAPGQRLQCEDYSES